MNSNKRGGTLLLWLSSFALVVAAATVYGVRPERRTGAEAPAPATQDVIGLERRLSMLEQRFNSVELSINRIEQQSRLSGITPSANTRAQDAQVNLLRAQVEALQRRLTEIECGLLRVDERTFAPAAREARRSAGTIGNDPCRLNRDAPLRLQGRP